MNRPILATALFAFASAALCAQQQSVPYSGTSNPPPDQTIESTEPQQAQPLPKPNPGKPLDAQPAAPQAQSNTTTPSASGTDPNDGTDSGMVQVAPSSPAAQPTVTVRASASDPDGESSILPHSLRSHRRRIHDPRPSARPSFHGGFAKGDAFRTRVASDVVEGGQVIIPSGAEINGRIVDVSSGRIGGRGSMRLQPENVIMPNGNRFILTPSLPARPGQRSKPTMKAPSAPKRVSSAAPSNTAQPWARALSPARLLAGPREPSPARSSAPVQLPCTCC